MYFQHYRAGRVLSWGSMALFFGKLYFPYTAVANTFWIVAALAKIILYKSSCELFQLGLK